ncbi:hypothetical protein BSM4216_3381 [Bacillus smithii]|nr:hypothetical protein BSM4216_3381 [Bacillus smithii]
MWSAWRDCIERKLSRGSRKSVKIFGAPSAFIRLADEEIQVLPL